MRLEFHQLERRGEHLRVQHPERQGRLLASLATSGQQTPIVVVPLPKQPDCYLVIDGYQRIAALQQLGRDTVEAVVWPLSEGEALVLDRSLRMAERATVLEEGWLLAELEQRFGYSLEELARRFDRSLSWVSHRLALIELLPESVQQQVRTGAIPPQVAMKVLVPVARSSPADCRRLADALATHRFTSREAGQLYAAWRKASPAIRRRILQEPQLFLKIQRKREPEPPSTALAELSRDLEMTAAILRRANRRLTGATIELDRNQCDQLRQQIERAQGELARLAVKIPSPSENSDVEPSPTDHDSGTACPGSQQARDCSGPEPLPFDGSQSPAVELDPSTAALAPGESGALPPANPGADADLPGESGAGARGAGRQRSQPVVLDTDRVLPPPWDQPTPATGGGKLRVPAG
jgi:ParB/RepB/Spo0J family partition protein